MSTPLARLRALSASLPPGSVLRGPMSGPRTPRLLADDLAWLLAEYDEKRESADGGDDEIHDDTRRE